MRWSVSVLLAAAVACGGPPGGGMLPDPPPAGWAERIDADRRARDAEFRSDPETPLVAEDVASFRGLAYWPPDPAYRFAGPIRLHERPERFTILSTTGKERPCERIGSVSFPLHGTECTLQVYRLLDAKEAPGAVSLFLPFTDATTGKETYPAGRYVPLEETSPGRYVLDFNLAANPLCAYGAPERFRCPVTPAENRLPVRVEAGERGYKRHAAGAP